MKYYYVWRRWEAVLQPLSLPYTALALWFTRLDANFCVDDRFRVWGVAMLCSHIRFVCVCASRLRSSVRTVYLFSGIFLLYTFPIPNNGNLFPCQASYMFGTKYVHRFDITIAPLLSFVVYLIALIDFYIKLYLFQYDTYNKYYVGSYILHI